MAYQDHVGMSPMAGEAQVEQGEGHASYGERRRPLGISLLAGWNMLAAVALALAAIGAGATTHDPEAAGALGAILGFMAVVSFAIGIGLWRLRNWARITAITLHSFSVVTGLLSLFLAGNPLGLLQVAVAGGIALYLTRQHVVEAFTG